MRTKIGLIVEGPIDEVLVSALLERIARDRAEFTWPVAPEDIGDIVPLRKRGHGGVYDALRRLVHHLQDHPPTDHAFFVIVLDRRTRPVQDKIRRLVRDKPRFVLAIAIEEIEAWWLGDRANTLAWLELDEDSLGRTRYGASKYKAERDPAPKRTLDELTELSDAVDRRYGKGNTELARQFTEEVWQEYARLEDIESQCPHGFRPFCKKATQALRTEKTKLGRLF